MKDVILGNSTNWDNAINTKKDQALWDIGGFEIERG